MASPHFFRKEKKRDQTLVRQKPNTLLNKLKFQLFTFHFSKI